MALNRNEIFRTAGWTGAVLLLAAGLRYSVEDVYKRQRLTRRNPLVVHIPLRGF